MAIVGSGEKIRVGGGGGEGRRRGGGKGENEDKREKRSGENEVEGPVLLGDAGDWEGGLLGVVHCGDD